jgi:hypothetical protein
MRICAEKEGAHRHKGHGGEEHVATEKKGAKRNKEQIGG